MVRAGLKEGDGIYRYMNKFTTNLRKHQELDVVLDKQSDSLKGFCLFFKDAIVKYCVTNE